jgi:hypothetical protein
MFSVRWNLSFQYYLEELRELTGLIYKSPLIHQSVYRHITAKMTIANLHDLSHSAPQDLQKIHQVSCYKIFFVTFVFFILNSNSVPLSLLCYENKTKISYVFAFSLFSPSFLPLFIHYSFHYL